MTEQATAGRSVKPTTKTLPVSEIYGPVCQGEGALIGRPTVFVRLGGCDYRCSWCDSLYAVLPKYVNEWTRMTAGDIVEGVLALGPCRHVTLSGGNPAIHDLFDLLVGFDNAGVRTAIETQGTMPKWWLKQIDDVTLSPKPFSSGNMTEFGPGSALSKCIEIAPQSILKVVAFTPEDYAYARAVHAQYPSTPFYLQAGTNVGVATRDDLCDALNHWQQTVLADPLMQDVAVLPQLHAVLKGHARGI
jgi:7-carboxy-7-deazaguanine synthase